MIKKFLFALGLSVLLVSGITLADCRDDLTPINNATGISLFGSNYNNESSAIGYFILDDAKTTCENLGCLYTERYSCIGVGEPHATNCASHLDSASCLDDTVSSCSWGTNSGKCSYNAYTIKSTQVTTMLGSLSEATDGVVGFLVSGSGIFFLIAGFLVVWYFLRGKARIKR